MIPDVIEMFFLNKWIYLYIYNAHVQNTGLVVWCLYQNKGYAKLTVQKLIMLLKIVIQEQVHQINYAGFYYLYAEYVSVILTKKFLNFSTVYQTNNIHS